MSRERLREGWVGAWQKFYSYSSMWQRFTLTRQSSWIQAAGFWPLNFMQHALAHRKIAGGEQRFRSGVRIEDDVPVAAAQAPIGEAAGGAPAVRREAKRQLSVVG
jgi:hypothetical protein